MEQHELPLLPNKKHKRNMDSSQRGQNQSSKNKPICCPTPEEELLNLVLTNDREGIRGHLEDNRECLTYKYVSKASRPILVIACRTVEVEAQTVKTLIDLGADLGYFDDIEGTLIHFAAMRTNKEVLKVVIDEMKKQKIDINVLAPGGNSALHYLIRYGKNKKPEKLIECAKLLIENGINVKALDNNNKPPIYWAKVMGYEEIEELLNERLEANVDENYSDVERLLQFVKGKNENEFIEFINNKGNPQDLLNCHNGRDAALQLACEIGLFKVVKHLIDNGVDPNLEINIKSKTISNTKKPIEIAADLGFHDIFQYLLFCPKIEVPVEVPIILLQRYNYTKVSPNKDYSECFQIFLKKLKTEKCKIDKFKKELIISKFGSVKKNIQIIEIKKLEMELKSEKAKLDIINKVDFLKNPPLHYAIRYADSKTVLDILSVGASLGPTNRWGFMPIRDMEAELLKNHLDSCVEYLAEQELITFNYETIIPPQKAEETFRNEEYRNSESSNTMPSSNEKPIAHKLECETQVISYMSQSSELKHLLKHPVIVSFLFMKWHRLKCGFWTNIAFYITFYITLLGYVFLDYVQFDKECISVLHKRLADVSLPLLVITFIMLILRELFQIIVSPKLYWTNLENYIELSLTTVTFAILVIRFPSPETRKQLSAFAILSAAFELILMIGQHPNCSTNVVMLRKICLNFFWFFIWYFLLILAFALSFYIIFIPTPRGNTGNTTDSIFIADPETSMFKTILMMAGEIGISDIGFQTIPLGSKLIFILSIFMISIILLNLLNGLAVSDIQTVRNDAELFGHICRAQNLMYIESMFLGNILPKAILKKIKGNFCCCSSSKDVHCLEMQPLAAVHLPTAGEITVDKNGIIKDDSFSGLSLDEDTMKRTQYIIQARKHHKENNEISELKEKLENLTNLINNWKTEVQTKNHIS